MPNIEELLHKAMQEGKFNDLSGKGKPLKKDEINPHADPAWELAYHVLRDAGYSLPWIETLQEIEKDIALARAELKRAWDWHQEGLSSSQPASRFSSEWKRAQNTFKDKLDALNKRIRDYNLQVPNTRFQRPILGYEQELQKINPSHN